MTNKSKNISNGVKNLSKKKKTIIIASAVSLIVIALGLGLGLGLEAESDGGGGGDITPTTDSGGGDRATSTLTEDKFNPVNGETSNDIVTTKALSHVIREKVDPSDSTQKIRTLRLYDGYGLNNSKFVLDNDADKSIRSKMDFIEMPYEYRVRVLEEMPGTISEDNREEKMFETIKEKLGFPLTFENSKIGFYLLAKNYNAVKNYQGLSLVEVSLPDITYKIPKGQFKDNKIERFEMSKYYNLETIEEEAFMNNKLKALAFSKTSPLSLRTIGARAFKGNDGTLLNEDTEFPEGLVSIGEEAIKIKDDIVITTSQIENNQISSSSFEGKVGEFKQYS